MQVRPGESIKVVYLVGPTDDVTTYYPRAVLRDSATGATISTTNLTQDASLTRRYTGSVTAPADPTGRGRWIDITITLYDDAGYTTPDTIYPENVQSYIVQERISTALLAAGATAGASSVGPDIDYKRIRKMLSDLLQTHHEAMMGAMPEMPEEKTPPTADEIAQKVHAMLVPETQSIKETVLSVGQDLTALGDGIPGLLQAHQDFGPVFARFEALGMSHEEVIKALEPAITSIVETIFTREAGRFAQSLALFVPHAIRDATAPSTGVPDGTEEPPSATRTRSHHEYLGPARALLGHQGNQI